MQEITLFRSDNQMVNRWLQLDLYQKLGFTPSKTMFINDLSLLFQVISLENGYVALPYSQLDESQLAQIHLPFHPKVYKLFLCPESHRLSELELTFIQMAHDAYQANLYYYQIS